MLFVCKKKWKKIIQKSYFSIEWFGDALLENVESSSLYIMNYCLPKLILKELFVDYTKPKVDKVRQVNYILNTEALRYVFDCMPKLISKPLNIRDNALLFQLLADYFLY